MKMLLARLRYHVLGFRKATEGVMTVEMVIMLPFLFWMITTSFELYEVHRYKAARIKATYTVADMLSREQAPVNDTYIDTAKTIFDAHTLDRGETQMRVTVLTFTEATDEYSVRWSEVRGNGPMSVLETDDIANAHDTLPILDGGEELILVESTSTYSPIFEYPGLNNDYDVNTRTFVGIRFAAQLCWEGSSCG